MSKLLLNLTAITDVGNIRKNNEDNFIVCQDLTTENWFIPQDGSEPFELGKLGSLMVVADGMGGMNAGEVASDIAVKTVREFFAPGNLTQDLVNNPTYILQYLKQVIIEADNRIKAKSREDESTSGMGTTIVISWILEDMAFIAWCGDSRAYSYHPNTGLRQLSKDHSYVQELVDSGKLKPELAFDHPDSNIITSSLGDLSKPAAPDVVTSNLHEGEIILLCSDGLCGMLRDNEIEQIIQSCYHDLTLCKKNLIEGALAAGGHDNVTLTMTKVVSGGNKMPAMNEPQPAINTNIPANDITHNQPEKNVKWKSIAIGLIIVILLAIIGVLVLKLRGDSSKDQKPNTELVPQDSVNKAPAAQPETTPAPSTTAKKDKANKNQLRDRVDQSRRPANANKDNDSEKNNDDGLEKITPKPTTSTNPETPTPITPTETPKAQE